MALSGCATGNCLDRQLKHVVVIVVVKLVACKSGRVNESSLPQLVSCSVNCKQPLFLMELGAGDSEEIPGKREPYLRSGQLCQL